MMEIKTNQNKTDMTKKHAKKMEYITEHSITASGESKANTATKLCKYVHFPGQQGKIE